MKKYKLKKEVKQYMFEDLWNDVKELRDWNILNVTIKALEEVSQRVELELITETDSGDVMLWKKFDFTAQEKDLCEKALNGELLDIDNIDSHHFEDWYNGNFDYAIREECGIASLLKLYLKENYDI